MSEGKTSGPAHAKADSHEVGHAEMMALLKEAHSAIDELMEENDRLRSAAVQAGGAAESEQRAALEAANARLVAECSELKRTLEQVRAENAELHAKTAPAPQGSPEAQLAAKQAQLDEAREALVQAKSLLDEIVFGKRAAHMS